MKEAKGIIHLHRNLGLYKNIGLYLGGIWDDWFKADSKKQEIWD